MLNTEFATITEDARNIWNVRSSGCWQSDFERGRRYAVQYINALNRGDCTPFFLTEIVRNFPDEIGTIEHGFLSEISSQLL